MNFSTSIKESSLIFSVDEPMNLLEVYYHLRRVYGLKGRFIIEPYVQLLKELNKINNQCLIDLIEEREEWSLLCTDCIHRELKQAELTRDITRLQLSNTRIRCVIASHTEFVRRSNECARS